MSLLAALQKDSKSKSLLKDKFRINRNIGKTAKLENRKPWDNSNIIGDKPREPLNFLRQSLEHAKIQSREASPTEQKNLEIFIPVKKKKIPYETLRIHLE